MNTPGSMALGWGSLMFAGGIAYYFAKKDINARRDEAHRRRLAHTPSASSNEAGQSYVSEIVGGAPDYTKQKYRIATGQATEGRDRGDRLG